MSQPKSIATFRENPKRAIHIFEDFEYELVAKLAPEILKLRHDSVDPITVYLHSAGGKPRWANMIRDLIRAPDQDGISRELTTVAIGRVASAAADFLAQGDYAICYENAVIYYHGISIQQQQAEPLTYEKATTLVSGIQTSNEQFARTLAKTIFFRFMFALMQFPSFQAFKSSNGQNLDDLVKELASKTSRQISKALFKCLEKTTDTFALSEAVISKVRTAKSKSFLVREKMMLNAIIERKAKFHRKDNWILGAGGIDEVVSDFKLFYDFHLGEHNEDRTEAQIGWARLLLSDAERDELAKFAESGKDTNEQNKWVTEKVEFRAIQLWYFLVSCCRLLQTDDFTFPPRDAYWMGLVHEVAGSNLPCLREMKEKLPTNDPPTAS